MYLIKLILLNLIIIKLEGIDLYKEQIINGDKMYNKYKFNILKHLSGISPYFESNENELNPNIPLNEYIIDKTIYLIRHGSIHINDYDYYFTIKPFLKRLNKIKKFFKKNLLKSKLNFLYKWKSPFNNLNIEKLTKSGLLESYELGIQLSYRYEKLLLKENSTKFRIWASSSERTRQTAFGILKGLFPYLNITNKQIISISEEKIHGVNTLTTTKTCPKYDSSKGSNESKIWLNLYTKSILNKFNFSFLPNDILAMQQICGYEILIKGSSLFCNLFTSYDWISFEYYFDIKYYYELFYGNYLSPYLGIHWIKSIINLLNKSSKQYIYLNIVHREMIPIVLVSLGLFNQTNYLNGYNISFNYPLNEIYFERLFKSSQFISFLSRIQIEKFSNFKNQSFIRILINSKPIPIPSCSQGPFFSCPFQLFINYINERFLRYKNFSDICELNSNSTNEQLTFYQHYP